MHTLDVTQDMLAGLPQTPGARYHLRLSVEPQNYGFQLIAREGEVPLKMVPPLVTLSKAAGASAPEDTTVELCDVLPGQALHVGVKGVAHCADYVLRAELRDSNAEACHALHTSSGGQGGDLEEIDLGHFTCVPHRQIAPGRPTHEFTVPTGSQVS